MIAALAFYAFAAILIASAVMVVSSRNPVHSVLFLILAFFNAAALFLIAGAEFLAMILVIVYVGAVAVLFLFVVMMLDIDFSRLREGFQRYAPVGWTFADQSAALRLSPNPGGDVTNAMAIGRILYTDYVYLFQASGLILLVAMIGAIVLTHRKSTTSRRQNIGAQVSRSGSVSLEKVPSGVGIGVLGIRRPPEPEAEKPAVTHDGGHGSHGGGHH
jgi:NADH-quinone oxidoreductase subunit J